MPRSKSSKQWLQEHLQDQYVKRSQEEGYRSRASYKLLELQDRDNFIKSGMTVVDLGAAPGGWSQVVAGVVGDTGRVIASDILPMKSIPGVEFVEGDFTQDEVLELLLDRLKDGGVDLLISDMAPKMSGMKDIDQPRAMFLSELALNLAKTILKPDAYIVIKAFQGEGFEAFLSAMRMTFRTVKVRKPQASRARSRETYLLGVGFLGDS